MIPAAHGTDERRGQDRAMILDPDRWPAWPRLPIKNPGRFNDSEERAFGVLLAEDVRESGPITVRLHLIFEAANGATERFDDVDALLDAGWTVD